MARTRKVEMAPPVFCFTLPEGVAVVFNDGYQKELRCVTPVAAEIIVEIAKSEKFRTKGRERIALLKLARQIAGRYSGHPIN